MAALGVQSMFLPTLYGGAITEWVNEPCVWIDQWNFMDSPFKDWKPYMYRISPKCDESTHTPPKHNIHLK